MARGAAAFLMGESGGLSIEFVVFFPLLMLWFVTCVNLFNSYRASYQAVYATQTVGEILSLQDQADPALMQQLGRVMDRALLPSVQGEVLRVSNLVWDETESAWAVDWSATEPAGRTGLSTATLPMATLPMGGPGTSVLWVEAFVPYQPFVALGAEPQLWHIRQAHWPRGATPATGVAFVP